jgi:peptidoglycan/LPS O-acetylase OafA/YrhL
MTETIRTERPISGEARVTGLDGIRGVMTLMVVISHFFGEMPNGIESTRVGWFAVIGFFALSGFLIGRLILERQHHANFFSIFYIRRILRMMPPFFVVLAALYGAFALIGDRHWAHIDVAFPAWTYATFTQNFYMIYQDALGPHWLAPTWTLAVEEHFYLLAPATLVFTPRRHLLKALIAVTLLSLALRCYLLSVGMMFPARVLFPAVADTIVIGIIAALAWKTNGINWARWDLSLRLAAPVTLTTAALLKLVDDKSGTIMFSTLGTTLIAIGASCLILSILRGAPEAKRFESRVLCFFGHLSYCIYLTHMAVLGLMHGLILGTRPDLATSAQLWVSVAALPVAVAVGWLLYRAVEEPCMQFARRFAWSRDARTEKAATGTVTA